MAAAFASGASAMAAVYPSPASVLSHLLIGHKNLPIRPRVKTNLCISSIIPPHNCCCFSRALVSPIGRKRIRIVNSSSEEPTSKHADVEPDDFREESNMPEEFKQFTKENPEPINWWPWIIAGCFCLYSWERVSKELRIWFLGGISIIFFLIHRSTLALQHFIAFLTTQPLIPLRILHILYRKLLSSTTALHQLTLALLLSSLILSISEAAFPDSTTSQHRILTLSGWTSVAASLGIIPHAFLYAWLLLSCLWNRFVDRKDIIPSVLPAAVVSAAVGDPWWVRVVAIVLFAALAVYRSPLGRVHECPRRLPRRLPSPLVAVAVVLAVRIFGNWISHRHLVWKIT